MPSLQTRLRMVLAKKEMHLFRTLSFLFLRMPQTRSLFADSSMSLGISVGSFCLSPSMVMTNSPRAFLKPASKALDWPKFFVKTSVRRKGLSLPISFKMERVLSLEPSSMQTISQGAPNWDMTFSTSSTRGRIFPSSSFSGTTIEYLIDIFSLFFRSIVPENTLNWNFFNKN